MRLLGCLLRADPQVHGRVAPVPLYPIAPAKAYISSGDSTDVPVIEQRIEVWGGATCKNYIISKKYYNVQHLLEDNNKQVYFDKEFDTTNYSLIDEKYKKQRAELTNEELIIYLTDDLKTKSKLDEGTAEYMATTLVIQAKKVREGDYALLVTSVEGSDQADKMDYYIRTNDIWVLDENQDSAAFIKDPDILCNLEYNCLYNTSAKCETIDVSKDNIVNIALKNIIDQFDKNYEISKDELNSKITTHLEYYKKTFERLQHLKHTQYFKSNNEQYNLG